MFLDENGFVNAFNQWVQSNATSPKPKNCGPSGSVTDCVPATQVGLQAGLKCNAVGANGLCNNDSPLTPPLYVAFGYLNNKDTGGVWIMNTAYPSKNDKCM